MVRAILVIVSLSNGLSLYHIFLHASLMCDFSKTFVVKYDTCGQSGLDIHRDSSEFSFVLLLSDPSDFEGGGTIYKEKNLLVNPDEKGSIAIHFGKLYHGGKNITKGTRYILIGFLKTKSNKLMIPNYDENKQFVNQFILMCNIMTN